jgi:hypothetical protein
VQNCRYQASPVDSVRPYQGWALVTFSDASDRDRQPTTEYVARSADCDVLLCVSDDFEPSQPRFEWLVRTGFPQGLRRRTGVTTPIDNDDIDGAIALERSAA